MTAMVFFLILDFDFFWVKFLSGDFWMIITSSFPDEFIKSQGRKTAYESCGLLICLHFTMT